MTTSPWTRSNRDHLIVTQPTARQARARELMLRGLDLDEIAKLMGVSQIAAWNYLHEACRKLVEAERLGHGTDSAIHNRGQPYG